MNGANAAQPDVTLLLDLNGIIKEVSLSHALADEGVDAWVGQPWVDTVADMGAEKVRRMVEDSRASRVSVFRQLTQRFPSGRELLMEYTTVRLGGKAGLLAIGKNLQAVAELQSRLVAAQQAMERDYWKLREIETRYRLLFDASNEAVLLLKASNLSIVEANPAAIRALGMSPTGREFIKELPPQEHEPFQAMLFRVREHGKAPGILVHLGQNREPWFVRASLMAAEPGHAYLLQLAPVKDTRLNSSRSDPVSLEDLFARWPDGFLALDLEGLILRTNQAFLDMIQVGAEASVIGQKLSRWLGRPGADLMVLLANIRTYGVVRLFSTSVHGELGTDTEVEISAISNNINDPRYIGVLIRDVGWRIPSSTNHNDRLGTSLGMLTEQIGKTSLQKLVKDTTGVVERHYIEAALKLTSGNRTASAELLGLSRQSLYAKLNRYGLDKDS